MSGFVNNVYVYEDEDMEPINWRRFPFSVPAIKNMGALDLHPAITFLAGENGSGKSTLIEAMAIRLGFGEQGGTRNFTFGQREVDGGLHDYLRFDRTPGHRRETDGFFLRAESFFNVSTEIDELEKVEPGKMYRNYGGKSLHQLSHGEAFIALVQNRFHDESLFFLDEPEAALSPARQLVLLKEIHWLVQSGCQFVIATHSPILMAYPNSTLYWLDQDGISKRDWDDIEHVDLTRAFLNSPKAFLRHLLD